MPDTMKNRGPRDRQLISLTEDWEVKYWSKSLGCSVMDLKKAVDTVGHSSAKVKDYLQHRA